MMVFPSPNHPENIKDISGIGFGIPADAGFRQTRA